MKLHFPWVDMLPLLLEIKTATTARSLYGQENPAGLWIVGDQGVYLMPNTTDGVHHSVKDSKPLVVYARECDPTKLAFDTWWANKQASFGRDDGVEFIDTTQFVEAAHGKNPVKNARHIVVEFLGEQFSISLE